MSLVLEHIVSFRTRAGLQRRESAVFLFHAFHAGLNARRVRHRRVYGGSIVFGQRDRRSASPFETKTAFCTAIQDGSSNGLGDRFSDAEV
jgi:hypothetical protein